MVTSGNTNSVNIYYIEKTTGNIGLVGESNSPDLNACYSPITEIYSNILATIYPTIKETTSSSTNSNNYFYIGVPIGVGYINTTTTPDLTAVYSPFSGALQGDSNVVAAIVPIYKDNPKDIQAYFRAKNTVEYNIAATYTGYGARDLEAYVIPTFSGLADLPNFIEAIPPVDLFSKYNTRDFFDIAANMGSIEGIGLSATVSGSTYKQLIANIIGYDNTDLTASFSGLYGKDLQTSLVANYKDTLNMSGSYYGKRETLDNMLYGYIKETDSSNVVLPSNITANTYSDLEGEILPNSQGIISSTISGKYLDNQLIGNVQSKGGLSNLTSNISCRGIQTSELVSVITGHGLTELYATIDLNKSSGLPAYILADNILLSSYLGGSYTTGEIKEIESVILADKDNNLRANIACILPYNLGAIITPKIYYISDSILINTYPISNLRVLINSTECLNSSDFNNLAVSIYGSNDLELKASVTSVVGQWVIAQDIKHVELDSTKFFENWKFLITTSPTITENIYSMSITTTPLSDIQAHIDGVLETKDLEANINSVFIPSIPLVSNASLGEWVNTYTGERKKVTIYFKGAIDKFYYFNESNTTIPIDKGSLEIIVESYSIEGTEGSLLATKANSREYKISNIGDFSTLDEAIKYAIIGAVGELQQELSASIEGIGLVTDLQTSISGIDLSLIKDINSQIYAFNSRNLSGNLTGKGDISDLSTSLLTKNVALTSTPFLGNNGKYYTSTVVINNNIPCVSLVEVNPGLLDFNSPDLYTNISGLGISEVLTTITGYNV